MQIVRMTYSSRPWRLVTSDGLEVTTTLRDADGRVVATGHPVCGNTKSEVLAFCLSELERLAKKESQSDHVRGAKHEWVR